MPEFNQLTGEQIALNYFDPGIITGVIIVLIVTILASGAYPAIYLANREPLNILKGQKGTVKGNSKLRTGLLIFQFTISIFLIMSTIIVSRQLKHMTNTELGMDYEQVLTVSVNSQKFWGKNEDRITGREFFREQVMKINGIEDVTYLSQLPGAVGNTNTVTLKNGKEVPLKFITTDEHFIDFMKLDLLQGRKLSYKTQGNEVKDIVLNETAVKEMELKEPLGATFYDGKLKVVGVVKDFHFNSLHNTIEPAAIVMQSYNSMACIKIRTTELKKTIAKIEDLYKDFCPDRPFNYDFMDEQFAASYEKEMRLSKILTVFSLLAIALSAVGLFSISSFITEQRRKEIGIRKVMGASSGKILKIFSAKYSLWVILAYIIAVPAAYYVMNNWLEEYPYKITIGFWIFVIPGLIVLLISFLSMGYQTMRAASRNPVNSIRYE